METTRGVTLVPPARRGRRPLPGCPAQSWLQQGTQARCSRWQRENSWAEETLTTGQKQHEGETSIRRSPLWLQQNLPLSAALLGVAGTRGRLLGGGRGLGGTGCTGQVQDRRTVVDLLLLALPGVVLSYHLLSERQTGRQTASPH